MEMFMQMAKECASKEGASQADVDEMAARKPASSKGGKCIRACISENVGIVCSFSLFVLESCDERCIMYSYSNFR